jgi:hypothetical protein
VLVIGPLQYVFYHSITVDRFLSGEIRVRGSEGVG